MAEGDEDVPSPGERSQHHTVIQLLPAEGKLGKDLKVAHLLDLRGVAGEINGEVEEKCRREERWVRDGGGSSVFDVPVDVSPTYVASLELERVRSKERQPSSDWITERRQGTSLIDTWQAVGPEWADP